MDYLFATGDLRQVLRAQLVKMEKAAVALPPTQILGRSVDETVAELVEEFRVNPLVLHWDQISADHSEADVEASGDWDRVVFDGSRVPNFTGTTVTYFVPFDGDEVLFELQPSTFTTNPPSGRVRGGELSFSFTVLDATAEQVKQELDRYRASIKQYADWQEADVDAFNRALPGQARAAVGARHQKLLRDRELVASLGVPLRRREDFPETYVASSIRRKSPVRRTATPATSRAVAPEPMLLAVEYDHILQIARNMVTVMERSPRAFVGMAEEDLRQHFLVQLNGAYEGQATGETFNFEGKTDILVREGGRNVFIAECKFWRGPKALHAAVDQLLGYSSWRDTKTAILLFNRGRELSKVLAQVPQVLRSHPNFVRELPRPDETTFRVVLHHQDDPERELTLTVLVFEVPA